MQMSEFEIVFDFKAAKKKREQISILADLNQCSRDKIREILLRNGISEEELPKKPGKSRKTEPEIFQQQIKKNHAKVDELRSGKPEEKPEEAAESEEEVAPENKEELLPWPDPVVEETAEPEVVHAETRNKVPEAVQKACRDRIWRIIQEIAELEREKRELQVFLGASE